MKKINVQGLAAKLNRVVLVTAVVVVALVGKRAAAQIVDNGYFQDNASSFSSYAGGAYGYYGNGTIEGFAGTAAGGEGLNGYDVHYNGGTETQFAPSGYAGSLNSMSDPLDFAYIQNTGYSLTQTLAEFESPLHL